ncbi:MBL fold metallo-hydrolase [Pasteurellaceae bacterium HPA106]|uniref:MBL fold metallo-hydrolase n=1 Tax=Spirabiliibacterium pneumoniae TaxID=221400 RepID=UPI001AAC4E4B|nr:MBL fold metallo-hydrolase [Spirabiliibacterium pneumoniae]MBE2895343.1 MBL fold metallo-hydrolase [Spirabiliibacterium pneumoniae]
MLPEKIKQMELKMILYNRNCNKMSLNSKENHIVYQHIRNATAKIKIGNLVLLVDPFFASKGSCPPFSCPANSFKNPLIDLPVSIDSIVADVDAVIITHTHLDHWDSTAQVVLKKNIPIFVQNEKDKNTVITQGFRNVTVVGQSTQFKNLILTKIAGQHGTSEMYANPSIAKRLGESMGILIHEINDSSLYLVGDTIWIDEVESVITQLQPDIIVLNTGYARITNDKGSIIMGYDDVYRCYHLSPNSSLITVHMNALNHCTITSEDMKKFIMENKLQDRVYIPKEGEVIGFM